MRLPCGLNTMANSQSPIVLVLFSFLINSLDTVFCADHEQHLLQARPRVLQSSCEVKLAHLGNVGLWYCMIESMLWVETR